MTDTPAADRPPADRPPSDRPPSDRPPSDRPPSAPPPRPRPRPGSAARSEPPVDPEPDPDRPVDDAGSTAAGGEPEVVGPRRAHRRRAEKARTDRVGWMRWVAIAAALGVVVAATVLVTLLVRGSGSTTASPSSSPTASLTNDTSAQIVDPQRASAFLAGASSDIAAVTTYDYRSLDEALNAGLAVTTGKYRTDYQAALTGSVATSAKQNHTVQTFDLLKLGIGTISSDGNTAKVLVFGAQHVTDTASGATPRTQLVTITATIVRAGPRYLIGALDSGTSAGLPPGTTGLELAAEAGRQEVVNLLSYRRAHFAQDRQRALAGAVDPLRTRITSDTAGTLAALTKGGYDLTGAVTALALERAQGSSVVLLLAATGSRVASNGSTTPSTMGRYEVTVGYTNGKWIASNVTSVGSS